MFGHIINLTLYRWQNIKDTKARPAKQLQFVLGVYEDAGFSNQDIAAGCDDGKDAIRKIKNFDQSVSTETLDKVALGCVLFLEELENICADASESATESAAPLSPDAGSVQKKGEGEGKENVAVDGVGGGGKTLAPGGLTKMLAGVLSQHPNKEDRNLLLLELGQSLRPPGGDARAQPKGEGDD
jgi:hypothetical protein